MASAASSLGVKEFKATEFAAKFVSVVLSAPIVGKSVGILPKPFLL